LPVQTEAAVQAEVAVQAVLRAISRGYLNEAGCLAKGVLSKKGRGN
jgi:hypothetical protein